MSKFRKLMFFRAVLPGADSNIHNLLKYQSIIWKEKIVSPFVSSIKKLILGSQKMQEKQV